MASGVEDPGFDKIAKGRTSFKGVEGALTYNDALVVSPACTDEMSRRPPSLTKFVAAR